MFSHFRNGIVPIETKLGRYVSNIVSERICKLGNMAEDKIHYVYISCMRMCSAEIFLKNQLQVLNHHH